MQKLLTVLAVVGCAAVANAQVSNGGFETGDLTGWSSGGDLSFTGVTGLNVHSGSFSYQMGPVSGAGFIEQSVPGFSAGQNVSLDFWLAADDGGVVFNAIIDGQTVASFGSTGFGYTQFSFPVTLTNSNPVIRFEFQHPPAYWYLDDVSVSLVPAPGAAMMALVGLPVLARRRRR